MAKIKEVKKEGVNLASAGLFIPAGLFIGLGLGFLFQQKVAGTLLGLGAGFLLAGLFKFLKR